MAPTDEKRVKVRNLVRGDSVFVNGHWCNISSAQRDGSTVWLDFDRELFQVKIHQRSKLLARVAPLTQEAPQP